MVPGRLRRDERDDISKFFSLIKRRLLEPRVCERPHGHILNKMDKNDKLDPTVEISSPDKL
jgi:hypothetical protein